MRNQNSEVQVLYLYIPTLSAVPQAAPQNHRDYEKIIAKHYIKADVFVNVNIFFFLWGLL